MVKYCIKKRDKNAYYCMGDVFMQDVSKAMHFKSTDTAYDRLLIYLRKYKCCSEYKDLVLNQVEILQKFEILPVAQINAENENARISPAKNENILISTKNIIVKNENEVISPIINSDSYYNAVVGSELPDYIKKLADEFKTVTDFYHNKQKELKELNLKLSNIDKEIVDYQHYIEFNDFGMYPAYKLVKLLHDKLTERREIKNSILVITNILSTCSEEKKFIDTFKSINGLESLQYSPRALPELFE